MVKNVRGFAFFIVGLALFATTTQNGHGKGLPLIELPVKPPAPAMQLQEYEGEAFDLEKYTKVERTRYGCPVTIKVRHGAKDRTDGPGPMRCRTDSGFGRQVVSTQKNGPACSFGRRGRARKLDDGGPGPGAYG